MNEPLDMQTFDADQAEATTDPAAAGDGGSTKPSLSKANLLLATLFLAGLGGVYLLSLRGGPAEASAEQQAVKMQVEAALTAISGAPKSRKAREVVESFYRAAADRQIPLKDLSGNPFVYSPPPRLEPVKPEKPAPDQKSEEDPAARRLSEAMEKIRDVQLQSVLMGSTPTAMISNNLLTEGQTLQGWTVAEIDTRRVVLTWQGHRHVLTME